MQLTPEQLEIVTKVYKAFKEAIRKAIMAIRRLWLEIKLYLLKTPEGRRLLMKIVPNNTWRRMHGLPMIRRARSNI